MTSHFHVGVVAAALTLPAHAGAASMPVGFDSQQQISKTTLGQRCGVGYRFGLDSGGRFYAGGQAADPTCNVSYGYFADWTAELIPGTFISGAGHMAGASNVRVFNFYSPVSTLDYRGKANNANVFLKLTTTGYGSTAPEVHDVNNK